MTGPTTKFWLLTIFVLALVVRFLYFPQSVYFGYDQARDAYESQKIYTQGDLKILGPTAAFSGLSHGPLYWYLIGPMYLLAGQDPLVPAAMLTFINALGVFLIWWLGKTVFSPVVGLMAALMYAFSFEENQYSLYFGNPAPAVLSVLTMYLGWALVLFGKRPSGLILVGVGLGSAIQFEFFLVYLIIPCLLIVVLNWKNFLSVVTGKFLALGAASFLITIGSYVVAEIKFRFLITKSVLGLTTTSTGGFSEYFGYLGVFWQRLVRQVHDNIFFVEGKLPEIIAIFTIVFVIWRRSVFASDSKKIIFLVVWIFGPLTTYLAGEYTLYYLNVGTAAGLIILASFLLSRLSIPYPRLSIGLVVVAVITNLWGVIGQNHKGPIREIYVQSGMLLVNERKAIDYIYQQARAKPFAINALTMPYNIKTTWAYLFTTYGLSRYGYLPQWSSTTDAKGYPGELPIEGNDYRCLRFTIVEPHFFMPTHLVDGYLQTENIFSYVVEEKSFGQGLSVQKRQRNLGPEEKCS